MEQITKNICDAIKYSGKRKIDIAKEIGIATSTLAEYQSGKTFPSIKTFKKFCEVCDCSADEVLGLKK